MMLRKFRIKTRLLISFFIIVLFTLIVGLTGYTRLISLGDSAVRTINNVSVLNDAYDYNIAIDAGIFGMLYTSDITLTNYVLQTTKEHTEGFLIYLNEYLKLQDQFGDVFTPGEKQDMVNLLEMYEGNYIPVVNEIFDLVEQGLREEALSVYINRFTPIFDTFIYYVNSVFMENLRYSIAETAINNESASISAFLMLAVVLLSLFVSVILALAVTKSIAVPLSELGLAAGKVANGEFDVQFEVSQSNDEIAHLSQRLDETLQQLHQVQQLKLEAIEARFEKEKAETANRTKSGFRATMSHEIRTPMNAIIGIAQIQLQKENLPDEYASALRMINNSGNNLMGIINDILDLSKIETGKLELNLSEYDMPSLINDTVQLNIVRIGSKPIEFKLDVDENLPSRLYGDELRLKQILNNLLSNAIKYTEKGQVKLTVNHTAAGEKGQPDSPITLRFIVEDTGQGMKGEDQNQLFSEYLRFNAEANRGTEGTGLGLNITRSLVQMMDGAITVESEYGKGSKFTVTVKQKAVEAPVIGAEVAQQLCNFMFTDDRQIAKLHITREFMPNGSVLVVDDVDTNLYVAEGLLAPYKLKIETANSGFEAIDKVQATRGGTTESGVANTYDIIFMDHMMPGMDGIETTEKLRELGYNGVIIALTANAVSGMREMFIEKGFNDFIAKPIDISKLDEMLNRWIPREKRGVGSEELGVRNEEQYLFPNIPGVDTKKGIAMTGGTEEGYLRILSAFSADVEERLPLLQAAPSTSNLIEFITQVHALKSVSATIGAAQVSAQAEKLEAAGNSRDFVFIQENLGNFAESLAELAKNIRMFLETNSKTGNVETAVSEDTVPLLRELEDALVSQKASSDILHILDELNKKPLDQKTREALEKISFQVLMTEFDNALQTVKELRK
jgi:signal transduction histidine kinase/FixJ family two-component response regulator/HPt (histidine-containing phosphotransfer) domain-containing protein